MADQVNLPKPDDKDDKATKSEVGAECTPSSAGAYRELAGMRGAIQDSFSTPNADDVLGRLALATPSDSSEKAGYKISDEQVERVANSLSLPDGGMIKLDRQMFKEAFSKGGQEAENKLVQAVQEKIKASGSKSVFRVDTEKDGDTVTKSYLLTDGQTGNKKQLFVANFDSKGNEIKPADFIAAKLADGNVTAQEKQLIEKNLQAAYRDNAVGANPERFMDGAFCLGSLFENKLVHDINQKLKDLNPDAGQLVSAKDELGATTRAYSFAGKPLIDTQLDLEHKDQDKATAKWYSDAIVNGSTDPNLRTYFDHALVSAYKDYGMAGVNEMVSQINKQMGSAATLINDQLNNNTGRATFYATKNNTAVGLSGLDLTNSHSIEAAEKAYLKLITPPPDPDIPMGVSAGPA